MVWMREGFVYLARAEGAQGVKIGFTREAVRFRMGTLQSQLQKPVVLLASVAVYEPVMVERKLHQYFQAYALGHEWFMLDEEAIESFLHVVETIVDELDLPHKPHPLAGITTTSKRPVRQEAEEG